MIELWGIRTDYHQERIGGDFEPNEVRELVATFNTREMAESYVSAAKRKNPPRRTAFSRPTTFLKKSLLGYYDGVEIESMEEPDYPPPHNPTL
jgi:hypothetical protein